MSSSKVIKQNNLFSTHMSKLGSKKGRIKSKLKDLISPEVREKLLQQFRGRPSKKRQVTT